MRLYLLGNPIAHSISPAIQGVALAELGLDWTYDLLECDAASLPTAARVLRDADFAGANVTIPHKETIGAYLDEIGASAREIGAVNTIVRRSGRLVGENTDSVGLGRSLVEAGVTLAGGRALVLGAGGAARAAVHALATLGASRISVANRSSERALRLVSDLRPLFPGVALLAVESAGSAGDVDIVVNARPSSVPLDSSDLKLAAGAVACDLAYRPEITPFLRTMMDSGARPVGGLGMLVHQAVASLEYWTGRRPSTDAMFAAARLVLADSAPGASR